MSENNENSGNGKKGLILLLKSSPKDLPMWVWVVALLFLPQLFPALASNIPGLSGKAIQTSQISGVSVEKFNALLKETEKVVELTDRVAGTVIALDVHMTSVKEDLKDISDRLRNLEKKQ